MNEQKVCHGFESAFIKSWEAWEEVDVCALYFYNCLLKEDMFDKDFLSSISGKKIDTFFDLQKNLFEVYDSSELEGKSTDSWGHAVLLTKKIKLVFEE